MVLSARHAGPGVRPDSTLLEFQVKDSGCGIEPAELDKIFQPFHQTEQGIELGEGTGLGLAICREYSHLLKGELSVDSTPGEGTRFRFRLSLDVTEAPAAKTAAGKVKGLSAGQPESRILVVEDQVDSQRLLLTLLQQTGFQAQVAGNGREALARFRDWQPHFIFMDMRMPDMDGYAATRAIRSLPGGSELPIVALTASAFEEDRPRILDAGCNEVIKKPLRAEQIFQVLQQFLDIRYDYSEDAPEPQAQPAATGFELPAEQRRELLELAIALDSDGLRERAEALRDGYPDSVRQILELVDRYQFETLQQLLETG